MPVQKKLFRTTRIFLWFSSVMTAASLLLNGLLYRESKLRELRLKLDRGLLPHFAAIRSIHEPEPDEAPDSRDGHLVIHRRDIANRLRSYNHTLNIGRAKAVINTLLLAGLGLAAVFGVIGLIRRGSDGNKK